MRTVSTSIFSNPTHADLPLSCMLDIVGARFHCAICDSVDICANCESAGLPGNLDAADGGHDSSHIMIKIPYPLDSAELQTASRRAIDLWRGRDAASVGVSLPRSKPSSVVSGYARTVVGSAAAPVYAQMQQQARHINTQPGIPEHIHHSLSLLCSQPLAKIRIVHRIQICIYVSYTYCASLFTADPFG